MGILENLNEVLGKIAAAAEKSGRNPDDLRRTGGPAGQRTAGRFAVIGN